LTKAAATTPRGARDFSRSAVLVTGGGVGYPRHDVAQARRASTAQVD
jgi:hypothetical protein